MIRMFMFSYRGDLGFNSLPEEGVVIGVVGATIVPHPQHVVTHTHGQTPRVEGRGAYAVDETTHGGDGTLGFQT